MHLTDLDVGISRIVRGGMFGSYKHRIAMQFAGIADPWMAYTSEYGDAERFVEYVVQRRQARASGSIPAWYAANGAYHAQDFVLGLRVTQQLRDMQGWETLVQISDLHLLPERHPTRGQAKQWLAPLWLCLYPSSSTTDG